MKSEGEFNVFAIGGVDNREHHRVGSQARMERQLER
jgi:hypothetical protein